MKLTEEQRAIALRLMMEMCEEEDTGGSDEDFVIEIFSRFLAALPKPEAVAEMGQHGFFWTQHGFNTDTPVGTKFYTESPIAPPASEPEYVQIPSHIENDETGEVIPFDGGEITDGFTALFRYCPPASEQKPIAWFGSRKITMDYAEVLADTKAGFLFFPLYAAPQPEQENYKAQRDVTQALSDVIAERLRQQSVEGWTPEHDDQHKNGELALAAAAYAFNSVRSHQSPPHWWPWAPEWWKPTTARRDLVKAAALILARVEQIDRAAIASVKGGE